MFGWDTSALVVSMVVGSAGFIAMYYGRRMNRLPHGVVGLLLMISPMFMSSAAGMALAGAALLLALWMATRLGF